MTPTLTSCADAACVMAKQATTTGAATAAIIRLDIKKTSQISGDFGSISMGNVQNAIVGRKPEMVQAKSGYDGAGLRRARPAHYSSGALQEDLSMTAWTRIGIAIAVLAIAVLAIAVLAMGAIALAPCALVPASVAAERPLSDAQLKKINGWIADQGRDIAVSAIITEILGLTKNDETMSARGYAAL